MKQAPALTTIEISTINFYDEIAARGIGIAGDKDFWSAEMDRFKDYLPSGRVIDLGCGSGNATGGLAKRGYSYVGIDLSEGMLSHARKRFPDYDFRCMNISDLSFPEGNFNGFWASSSLHHVPKGRMGYALEEIGRVTKPGGIGFIAVREGIGEINPLFEADGRIRYFAFYHPEEMDWKLSRGGFDVLSWHRRNRGELVTFLCFYVKRRDRTP